MPDKISQATRSHNMSKIKGKDTKPELLIRRFLFANGFRYRLHDKKLPGKPDIILPKYETIILINGCFWHGHLNCNRASIPKTRTEWWLEKINKNIANDQKNTKALEEKGWKVLVIWTCKLRPILLNQSLEEIRKCILAKKSD